MDTAKKNKFSQYFITISVFTFIAIFILLVQSSYNNLMQPQTEALNSSLTKSLDLNLDVDLLKTIESKIEYK